MENKLDLDAERVAFEAHFEPTMDIRPETGKPDSYYFADVRAAWSGWQARASLAAPAQGELSDALPEKWQVRMEKSGRRECESLALEMMEQEIAELRAYAKQAIEARILGQQGGGDAADAARWRYVRDTETLETAVWEALEGTDCAPGGVLDKVAYARGMDTAVDRAIAAIQAQAGDAPMGGA